MINLYYDNIIDGVPAPNGAEEIALTNDARQIPYVKNYRTHSPIAKFNTFYFVMKAHKVAAKLYTKKAKFAKNLFYPIELNHFHYGWNRNLSNVPSARAKSLIKKGKMKLLILAPRITGGSYYIKLLKERINELVESGIDKDNIYIVLGELNNVYRNLLDTKHVYGFDWWQVYGQLIFKVRNNESSLHWISHTDKFLKKSNDEKLDLDNWNPTKIFNVSTSKRDHDISLLLELINKQTYDNGYFNFILEKYKLKKELTTAYVDPKKSTVEKHQKLGTIKHIEKYDSKIKQAEDILEYDIKHYTDSLFTIICAEHDINFNTEYKPEVASLSTDLRTWQHIAIGHPFAIIGPVDSVAYLNNEGYFTFNELVDQKYDTIYYSVKRVEYIVRNIKHIEKLPKDEIDNIINEIKPFLKKNKEKFFNKKMDGKFIQLFVDMMYE
jgi:hypothetical protein